jgi:peptidoglycan/LPS O-acetylase OafA/YrhL
MNNNSSPAPDKPHKTGKPFVFVNPVISADLSRKLSTVSFFAACFVVINHTCIHSGLHSQTTIWISTFLSKNMSLFAVSLFFAISGYLVAKKTDCGQTDGWYSTILKKRMRSLGIPYLIWCTVYSLTYLPFTLLGNHVAGRSLLHNTYLHEPALSIANFGRLYGLDLWGLPVAGTMWYVRNLLLLFLVLPLIFPVIRRRVAGLTYLFILFILYLIQDWFPDSIWQVLESGFSIRGLFYFPLGIYLALHPVSPDRFRIVRKLLPFIWAGGCVIVTCHMLYGEGKDLAFYQVLMKLITFAGVGAAWVLYDMVPAYRRMGTLSVTKDSFFLYASHYLIIATLFSGKIQDIMIGKLHVPELAFYCLKFLVTMTICLVTAEILKRYFPRIYGFLTGGR